MTEVRIEENPDRSPLAKAKGAVQGWETLLEDHRDAVVVAENKLTAAQQEVAHCEQIVIDAHAATLDAELELETARHNLAELEGTQDGVE